MSDPTYAAPEDDAYAEWARSQQAAPDAIEMPGMDARTGQELAPLPPEIEMPGMDARTGQDIPAPMDPYAEAMQQPPAAPVPTGEPDSAELEAGPEPWRNPQLPAEYANPQDFAAGKVGPAVNATPEQQRARQTAIDSMSPAQRARAVASMTPEELIDYTANRNASMLAQQTAAQSKADAENLQRQQANLAMQQASVAKADSDTRSMLNDAWRISNTKEDPGRYVKKMGIGKLVLDLASVTLGGAAAGGSGQKPLALEAFDKGIDNDIAAQRNDIANQWKGVETRKGAIADEYSRHGDMYKAQETYRVAAYQAAIQKMQTDLQQYDPQGATALYRRDQIDQLHGRMAQAVQSFNQTQIKNHQDAMKSASEYAEKMANADKLREETAGLQAKRIAAGAPAVPETPLDPSYYEDLGLKRPPAPMSMSAYKAWLPLVKAGGEATNTQLEGENKARANQMQVAGTTVRSPVTGDPMLDEKGQPIVMGSAELADKVNETTGWSQKYLDAMSSVRNALASDPSTFDRRKWSEIQANLGTAEEGHIKYLGAKVSSRELDATKEVMGADFDSYMSRIKDKGRAIASFDAFINNVKRDTDTELKVKLGYKGPSPLLDTSKPPEAAKGEVDKLGETLSVVAPPGSVSTFSDYAADPTEANARAGRESQSGMLDAHRDALSRLKDVIDTTKDDKVRTKALGVLHEAAVDGPSVAVRQGAARILADVALSQTSGSSEGDSATAEIQHETVPPAPRKQPNKPKGKH